MLYCLTWDTVHTYLVGVNKEADAVRLGLADDVSEVLQVLLVVLAGSVMLHSFPSHKPANKCQAPGTEP